LKHHKDLQIKSNYTSVHKMTGKIYCIENLENGKKYIGQTKLELHKRFNVHLCSNGCRKISNALKKYGRYCFAVDVLWEAAVFTQEELDHKEVEFIKELNTLHPNGYNLVAGGGGSLSPSEETRSLISTKVKEAWKNKGVKWIEERRKRGISLETRKKMADNARHRIENDPEFMKKLHEGKKNTITSEETRKKLSEANKNRTCEIIEEIAKKRRKKIYCFDTNGELVKIYDALTNLDKDGISNSSVRYHIKKGQPYMGFYFSYSSTLPFVPTPHA
jgi:group I intron endonuclease